ncbi:MAG: hypothetical protein IKZ65_00160 [Lachnospiraceae bacterium]|nr:hypothetical protein [Lachnospiraceae bacterium]
MGKEKNKLLDKKLDNVSLEQVSGGSGRPSLESMICPRCKTHHDVKYLGSARVSYNLKWTDAMKYSCDNVASALSTFYKVNVAGVGTVWLDVNFEEL